MSSARRLPSEIDRSLHPERAGYLAGAVANVDFGIAGEELEVTVPGSDRAGLWRSLFFRYDEYRVSVTEKGTP